MSVHLRRPEGCKLLAESLARQARAGGSNGSPIKDDDCYRRRPGYRSRPDNGVPGAGLPRRGQFTVFRGFRVRSRGEPRPGRRRYQRSLDRRADRGDGGGQVRLHRRPGKQRRPLLHESIHRLHTTRFRAAFRNEPTGLHLHHAVGGKADAATADGRQHHGYHQRDGGTPHRRRKSVVTDDHQGRTGGDHPQSRHGIREGANSFQCSGARRCEYADA